MSHPSKALHVIDELDERELTRMRSRKYACSILLTQRCISSQNITGTATTRTTLSVSASGENCYFTRRTNANSSKRSSSTTSSKVDRIPQEASRDNKYGGDIPEHNYLQMRQQEQQRRIPDYSEDFSDDENEDGDLLGLKFL